MSAANGHDLPGSLLTLVKSITDCAQDDEHAAPKDQETMKVRRVCIIIRPCGLSQLCFLVANCCNPTWPHNSG